jgi:hypothetical protein
LETKQTFRRCPFRACVALAQQYKRKGLNMLLTHIGVGDVKTNASQTFATDQDDCTRGGWEMAAEKERQGCAKS